MPYLTIWNVTLGLRPFTEKEWGAGLMLEDSNQNIVAIRLNAFAKNK